MSFTKLHLTILFSSLFFLRAVMSGSAYVVHPLVLTNICDHYDRVRRLDAEARAGGAPPASGEEAFRHVPGAPLCGLIFGLQTAQKVEICNSIEARVVLGAAGGGDDPINPAAEAQWALDCSLIARWVELCAWPPPVRQRARRASAALSPCALRPALPLSSLAPRTNPAPRAHSAPPPSHPPHHPLACAQASPSTLATSSWGGTPWWMSSRPCTRPCTSKCAPLMRSRCCCTCAPAAWRRA